MSDGAVAFTSAEGTIRSVRMPFSLYAAQTVLRNLLVLGHNVLVIIAVYVFLDAWPGLTAVLALPGLALWLIDGMAVCLLLGTVCARFRDIPPIVGSIMQIAFFVSAVIWKPEQLGRHEWLLAFNPFYALLEIVRAPLLGAVPSLTVWVSALLSSVALCGVAWVMFARVRGRIAFWI